MAAKVSLARVVEEMDVFGDEWSAYLNRRTGELETLAESDVLAVEDGQGEPEFLEEARIREILDSKDWLALPSKFDIHEYSIMERFCYGVEADEARDELLVAIRGPGAFRMFKDRIHRLCIQDDWYRFRQQAFEEIASDWLEANGIPYTRTLIHPGARAERIPRESDESKAKPFDKGSTPAGE
jgi:hypothetical protein